MQYLLNSARLCGNQLVYIRVIHLEQVYIACLQQLASLWMFCEVQVLQPFLCLFCLFCAVDFQTAY